MSIFLRNWLPSLDSNRVGFCRRGKRFWTIWLRCRFFPPTMLSNSESAQTNIIHLTNCTWPTRIRFIKIGSLAGQVYIRIDCSTKLTLSRLSLSAQGSHQPSSRLLFSILKTLHQRHKFQLSPVSQISTFKHQCHNFSSLHCSALLIITPNQYWIITIKALSENI